MASSSPPKSPPRTNSPPTLQFNLPADSAAAFGTSPSPNPLQKRVRFVSQAVLSPIREEGEVDVRQGRCPAWMYSICSCCLGKRPDGQSGDDEWGGEEWDTDEEELDDEDEEVGRTKRFHRQSANMRSPSEISAIVNAPGPQPSRNSLDVYRQKQQRLKAEQARNQPT